MGTAERTLPRHIVVPCFSNSGTQIIPHLLRRRVWTQAFRPYGGEGVDSAEAGDFFRLFDGDLGANLAGMKESPVLKVN